MSEPSFVLCYVDGPWAWFTTCPLDRQWGDDWNDAPYEHNAGEPYDWRPSMAEERTRPDGSVRAPIVEYRLMRLAWHGPLSTPEERWKCRESGSYNSPWSVQQINRGETSWLAPSCWDRPVEPVVIMAGASLIDFTQFAARAGCTVYAPMEGGQRGS